MGKLLARIAAGAFALAAPAGGAADGKTVYARTCAVCHDNISPKRGDRKTWAPRIEAGIDALVATVVKGKGAMPPNAGNKSLSEADIRAAVEYLVSESK